jgi:hypothetical protein
LSRTNSIPKKIHVLGGSDNDGRVRGYFGISGATGTLSSAARACLAITHATFPAMMIVAAVRGSIE